LTARKGKTQRFDATFVREKSIFHSARRFCAENARARPENLIPNAWGHGRLQSVRLTFFEIFK
jgi:hypothetical protein